MPSLLLAAGQRRPRRELAVGKDWPSSLSRRACERGVAAAISRRGAALESPPSDPEPRTRWIPGGSIGVVDGGVRSAGGDVGASSVRPSSRSAAVGCVRCGRVACSSVAVRGRTLEQARREPAARTGGNSRLPGGERFGGQADALAHELARAPGDRGGERDAEHAPATATQERSRASERSSGRPPGTRAPRPRRRPDDCPACASPCQARASVRAIARPRPLPAGPWRPARPRWKRSNTSSSSPGARPGPRSRTSMRPSPPATRHLAARRRVVRARSRSARRARGRGRRARTTRCPARSPPASSAIWRARGGRTPALDGALARHRARRSRSPCELAILGAAQHEQLVDDRGETVDLGGARRRARRRRRRRTPAARASSRRSRSAVSGVRSWWEASATNSRWAPISRSHAVGHLVEGGAERALLGAALDHRARDEIAAGEAPGGALQAPERAARPGARSARRRAGRAAARCRRRGRAWRRCCARRSAPRRRSG